MPRLLQNEALISFLEPKDYEAGIDSETFKFDKAQEALIILTLGALTGDGILTLYSGATAGAKTTALPFRYQLSGADFKAEAADQFGSLIEEADGILTLTAASFDHRVLKIWVDAVSLPDGHLYVTMNISNAADALLGAALAILGPARYQPAQSVVPLG